MSSDIAISVKNLTKTYRIFGHPGDRIRQAFTLGRLKFHKEFTALKDVSFEIKKGETVGIIGRNGSGKSTLLQLISGILKPTSGSVTVNGRVFALLELGSGFNPEFTGRENVYFQGVIMGVSKAEIDERFEEIAAFAEIGEFIDQPVRTYSSGMYVRLAFATAIHSNPDLLILDEVLAVGDIVFQRKCYEHLSRLIKEKEPAVILVSHDIRQVERFCSRVIFLQNGLCMANGSSHEVCQLYLEQSSRDMVAELFDTSERHTKISSSGEAELLSIDLLDQHDLSIREISSGDSLRVRIRFKLSVLLIQPELIVGTQTVDMLYLSSASTRELDIPYQLEAGEHVIEYAIDQFPMAPGGYFVRFGIRDENFRLIFAGEGLCPFVVLADSIEVKRPYRLLDLMTTWTFGGKTHSAR